MIRHTVYRLAARNRLRTLSVASVTGELGCSGSTYTRSTGSFLTDGFAPGMEVSASGFPAGTPDPNGLAIVTSVAALSLTVDRTLGTVASGAGRTVAVGLPSTFVLENSEVEDFSPPPGKPWVVEAYLPGGGPDLKTLGSGARVGLMPSYVARLYVPEKTGMLAASAYTDAIIAHFAPGLSLGLAAPDEAWVRWDRGPFPSQLIPAGAGWATLTVTIPLLIWATNTI